jgi:uncharacterized repeat protein (TIGR01451 family)
METGATLDGRALAQTGAVTMDSNTITSSICSSGTKELLTLTKTANPLTYDQAGQTITYTYDITNTGNVVLDGPFTVSDNKEAVTCLSPPASLNPGASFTCTASHIVTQADLDAGSITNTATASGKSVTSNQEQVTVTGQVIPIPEFPTVALPVIAVIGLMFLFQRRKVK